MSFVQIGVTIVDDNTWEPDEEFFLKLSLMSSDNAEEVKLGRTSIMEITILNDDGRTLTPSLMTPVLRAGKLPV